MSDEACLAKAAGFDSVTALFATPLDVTSERLRNAYTDQKSINEHELIFVATEWLAENAEGLGLKSATQKSPTITQWCRFLASLGCKKGEVIVEYQDAVSDRQETRGRQPFWGFSIGVIQREYNRHKAERVRAENTRAGLPMALNQTTAASAIVPASTKQKTGQLQAPAPSGLNVGITLKTFTTAALTPE